MIETIVQFVMRWSLLGVFLVGGLLTLMAVVAQIRYNRRQKSEYRRRLFGREVKDAELRKIERMGL